MKVSQLIKLVLLVSTVDITKNTPRRNVELPFATKTPYNNRLLPSLEDDALPWALDHVPSDLKPVLIDATLRHGTRFPSEKNVNIWRSAVSKFQQHLEKDGTYISPQLGSALKDWVLDKWFHKNRSYLLSSVGWEEHVSLGFKYYDMMPKLWQAIFENNKGNLHVLSSSKVRSLASARAFVTSMQHAVKESSRDTNNTSLHFDEEMVSDRRVGINNETLYGSITVKVNDKIVRYFDYCPKYSHNVDNNITAGEEFGNFLKSNTFKELRILRQVPHLSGKEVYQLYQICTFETAVYGKSAWCELFSKDDLLVLEYASDLKHYYKTGRGYAINYEQACILLDDVISHIRARAADSPKAVLRFGHAETLIPLTILLGFNHQHTPLTASNYEDNKKRPFRTGKISPFAGNIAIVLYESTKNGSLYISWVLNELIMKPFGLDCHICPFHTDSAAWKAVEKALKNTDCNAACRLDKELGEKSVKDEL